MRIMAIDYGDAHTGVAISDLTGLLAGYTTTIHSRRQEEVLDRLGSLIEEYGVPEKHGRDAGAPGRKGTSPGTGAAGAVFSAGGSLGRAADHHRRP